MQATSEQLQMVFTQPAFAAGDSVCLDQALQPSTCCAVVVLTWFHVSVKVAKLVNVS